MNRKKSMVILAAIAMALIVAVTGLSLATVTCPHCRGEGLEPMDVKLLSHRMERGEEDGKECYFVYAHVVNLGAPGMVTMRCEMWSNATPISRFGVPEVGAVQGYTSIGEKYFGHGQEETMTCVIPRRVLTSSSGALSVEYDVAIAGLAPLTHCSICMGSGRVSLLRMLTHRLPETEGPIAGPV